LRLARLLEIAMLGIDFRLLEAVDWSTGQLLPKRALKGGSSERTAVMAAFYNQRPR
jgi:hypothetical protein